jgi:hypothetical protein
MITIRQHGLLVSVLSVGVLFPASYGALAGEPAPPSLERSPVVSGQGYFPVALRLHDGRIAVVLRGGAPHVGVKGRLDMVFSSDQGKSWTKPTLVVDSPVDDRNPALGQAIMTGGSFFSCARWTVLCLTRIIHRRRWPCRNDEQTGIRCKGA